MLIPLEEGNAPVIVCRCSRSRWPPACCANSTVFNITFGWLAIAINFTRLTEFSRMAKSMAPRNSVAPTPDFKISASSGNPVAIV
jgi:hypothetical protein